MGNIDKYINNLMQEFIRQGNDGITSISNEGKLTLLHAHYCYFSGDNSRLDELLDGYVYLWGAPDKIAGIYIDYESEEEDIDIIVAQYTEDNTFNDYLANFSTFQSIEDIVFKVIADKGSIRNEVVTRLNDCTIDYNINKTINIKLVTNYNPKKNSDKKAIEKALSYYKPNHSNVKYKILFASDIEHEVLEIENPKEYVDSYTIDLDRENNYLVFGEERSVIVNISAKSLKSLYENYAYRGLFAQNLRYYVKNLNVDNNVVESITGAQDKFWYYNNGVILICDDYSFSGNSINLSKFSIINGGQTTKLVGETEFDNDFYIQCKVIKNKYLDDEDKLEFIANVASASNTQKPIKTSDLIANKIEQRLLKRNLANVGVYCQIKRGEKPDTRLYSQAWQKTTNEEVGQFLLAFVYQQPGAARGNKSSICGNSERYNLLFKKSYNERLICDLLKIKAYYKQWVKKVIKKDDGKDEFKIGLIKNGMFFVTSIIGVLCKVYYNKDLLKQIVDNVNSDKRFEFASQHDIDHSIFKYTETFEKDIYDLFEYCYARFFRYGYQLMKELKGKNVNSYSDFTKRNTNYEIFIFRSIILEYQNGIPQNAYSLFAKILHDASNDELNKDKSLLQKYANVTASSASNVKRVTRDIASKISDSLLEYRSCIIKTQKVKAFMVYTKEAVDRIADYAPSSIQELCQLRCLDASQIEMYGDNIINCVKLIIESNDVHID